MCAGSAAYKSQLNQYKRSVKEREVKWAGAKNLWATKVARFETQRNENVLAHSRQIGAIQRDFGLERDKFLKQKEDAYRSMIARAKAVSSPGDKALGFGRNTELAAHYAEGARWANLERKDIQQTERMQFANRKLIGMQNKAREDLGLKPIPGLAPAKPVPKGMLEWGIETAATAASIASGFGMGGGSGGSSDIRLKENIVKVGKALSGLNIYEWNYKSAPNSRYRGVMAQEVLTIFPEAVVKAFDGFLGVRYDLIDVDMELVK